MTSPAEETDTGAIDVVVVPSGRDLDLAALKALAHPLRVEIVDVLTTYGNFTASGLAERLGESSGATSYHLRQLEKHGFVREVEGMGTGRERWWERTPGAINIGSDKAMSSQAGRSASSMIWRQFNYSQNRLLQEFVDRGNDELVPEWIDASAISVATVRATPAQLDDLSKACQKLIDRFAAKRRTEKNLPGSRPVQIHFNAFPVIDGVETPTIPVSDDAKKTREN